MKLTEKQKNCPYCHGKDLINTLHDDWRAEPGDNLLGQAVHIEGNYLVVEENTTESKWINFCPICGRQLDEDDE